MYFWIFIRWTNGKYLYQLAINIRYSFNDALSLCSLAFLFMTVSMHLMIYFCIDPWSNSQTVCHSLLKQYGEFHNLNLGCCSCLQRDHHESRKYVNENNDMLVPLCTRWILKETCTYVIIWSIRLNKNLGTIDHSILELSNLWYWFICPL